jgi:TRAP-type C4-dicarboxylate transport system permease large subunit
LGSGDNNFLNLFRYPTPGSVLFWDVVALNGYLILNLVIGLLTPPVGAVLYVACGVGKISLERLVRSLWPLILIEIGVLFLITYVPVISLWLPKLLGFATGTP